MPVESALSSFAAGLALGVFLAAPPGPVIAIMAAESTRGNARASMATALGAISADAV